MKKSKIKIIKVYEGTRSARDVLTDAIADKVRRRLNSDREYIAERGIDRFGVELKGKNINRNKKVNN